MMLPGRVHPLALEAEQLLHRNRVAFGARNFRTLTTRRLPSLKRCTWTTIQGGSHLAAKRAQRDFNPVMPTMCSRRVSASRGALACTVVIEPS